MGKRTKMKRLKVLEYAIYFFSLHANEVKNVQQIERREGREREREREVQPFFVSLSVCLFVVCKIHLKFCTETYS